MRLNEWIENKSRELVESKAFKSASLRDLDTCQISSIMTRKCFSIGVKEPDIDTNINIQDVNRKELYNEIDAIEVCFDVVKPRCRKPERLRLYVQPVPVN